MTEIRCLGISYNVTGFHPLLVILLCIIGIALTIVVYLGISYLAILLAKWLVPELVLPYSNFAMAKLLTILMFLLRPNN